MAQQFGAAALFPAGDGIELRAAADFDGDGLTDLLVTTASGGVSLHPGDGRGGLSDPTRLTGPPLQDAADFTGDRVPDLFEVRRVDDEAVVLVRVADRRGDFGSVVSSGGGVTAVDVRDATPADVDGDGRSDLVIAAADGSDGSALWVAPGRGDGRFGHWWAAGRSHATHGFVTLADGDGDGRPDVAGLDDHGAVSISLSDPLDGFGPPRDWQIGDPASPLGPVAVGRFAGDSLVGLAVADESRGCIAVISAVAAQPSAPPCFSAAGRAEGLAAGDLDGDGLADLVQGLAGPQVAVLYSRAGGLTAPVPYPVQPASFVNGPHVIDLDADGRADVVAVADLRSLAVLRNIGTPKAEVAPAEVILPPVPVGTAAPDARVTVVSSGDWVLPLGAARLVGPDAGDFEIVDLCNRLILASGSSCAIRVRFTPQAVGDRFAVVVLHVGGSCRIVALRGRGV
jgi:hypothetical protein